MLGGNFFGKSDLLPYKKIYDNLSSYINDEKSAIHGEEHDLFDIIDKNWNIIKEPNNLNFNQHEIFNIKQKNASDEMKVKENKHEKNSDAAAWLSTIKGEHLNKVHIDAILKMSTDMKLNELECLRFWIAAVDEGNRLLVDVKNDHSKSYIELLAIAAPRLVRFEHTNLLNILFLLMENRSNDKLSEHKYKKLMILSNKLLKENIAVHILDSIKKCIINLKPNSSLAKTEEFDEIKHLRILSDSFFYMFYDTQAEITEAKKLYSICQEMEKFLVESNSNKDHNNDSWTIQCHKSLVSLQLTLIHVWQQDQLLLDRNCKDFPFSCKTKGNVLDQTEIVTVEDDLNGLEGFMYLINAFSHSEKEINENIDKFEVVVTYKEHIKNLLRTASEKRAYTYIRLCLLPVLRSSYSNNDILEYLHMAALNKLLQGVIVLSSKYYNDAKPHHNKPYLIHSATTNTKSEVDYLDDIIILYNEMCSAHPNFAFELCSCDPTFAFLHSTKDFLFDIVDSLQHQTNKDFFKDSLFLFFKFLTSIANSFNTLHISCGMNNVDVNEVYENMMKKIKLINGNNNSIDSFCRIYLNNFEMKFSSSAHKTMLSKEDEKTLPYLVKVVDLLASVAQSEKVANDILTKDKLEQDKKRPSLVGRLFSVYTSSVTIELKGSILRLLSSFAKNDEASAKEIWKLIEEHNLMYELVRQEGFRFDLQPDRPAESTSGQYHATYGFLELLEILFRRNVNNSLGLSFRRPGVIQYIDFLIDDVIISLTKNAKDFNYEPRDITGEAQRWRMISKAMKILVIILQHYNINNLPDNAVDNIISPDYHVSSPKLNDVEDLEDLILDFKEVNRQYSLSDGNCNFSTEDCIRPKTAGFAIMALILGNTPLLVTILNLLQECNISALDKNAIDISSLMTSYSVRVLGKMQPIRMSKTTRAENFSMIQFGESSCDSLYWRVKTISSCIGLLYEVGIREKRFLSLGRSVPLVSLQNGKGKLKLVRTVNNKPSILPVLFQYSLADVITSSKLHVISTFLTLEFKPLSFPSVPVMVAHLLEFIASQKSHGNFLSSLSDETSLNQGCIDVILNRKKGQSDTTSLGLGYICYIQPIGAEMSLDLFTDINSTVYRPPDLNAAIESAKRSGGARETLLNFFLKTLSSNGQCLSHVLLGINPNLLKACKTQRWDVIQASLSLNIRDPVPNYPCNCLDAIVELLGNQNLIVDAPNLSKTCFELLYRLCSSPLTSTIALGYLKKQSNNEGFLPTQIKLMKSLLVEVLADEVYAAARNCCAWLLKIFALELRALFKTTSRQDPKKEIEVLLELLFGLKTEYCPMIDILMSTINSVPSDNFEPVKSKILLNCLNEAAGPYYVGQTESEQTLFQVVNLDEFQRLAQENNISKISRDDYLNATQTAVSMNIYNQGLAAASHLCQAWSQVVSVSFQADCFNYLLNSDGVDRVEKVIQKITDKIILPIISEVKSNATLAMHMAEPIVRSYLTIIDAVRTVTFRCNMLILSEKQHEEILRNLIKSIVVRSNSLFLRDQSSNLYRGFLFNAISQMLHMTDGINACTLHPIIITNKGMEPEKCNETNVSVIEEFLPDLIDILGIDATGSNAIWRFSALSCLVTIFSILGPTRYKSGFIDGVDNRIGSHSFLRALDPLVRNNYLQHLLASMSPHSFEDDDLSLDGKKDLFKGVAALCLEIACSQEGAEALVNCGILEIIISLPPLSIPNSIPSDLAAFGFQDDVVRQEAHLDMEDKLMPLLNLLRTMASTSNLFQVLECCAAYIRKNFAVITYLLRFRISTLRGMEMTEAVVALATMVASAPANNSSFSTTSSPNQSNKVAISLWDSELGQKSDTLTSDISSLLANIGI